MTVTEATLTEITRRLVATYKPEQVVLFGSHAWGEPDESSDVDRRCVAQAPEAIAQHEGGPAGRGFGHRGELV